MFVTTAAQIQYVPLTIALVSVNNACYVRFVLVRIDSINLGEIISFLCLKRINLAILSY
jgi:hypothetical protein